VEAACAGGDVERVGTFAPKTALTRRAVQKTAPLWLAVHEVGHAVARLALDETLPYPGPMVKEVTVVRDGDHLGFARMDSRAPLDLRGHLDHMAPEHLSRNIRLQLVDALAGYVAELRQRQGVFGPGFVKDRVVAACLSAVEVENDFDAASGLAMWEAPGSEQALLGEAYRVACALVEREWLGIVDVARCLQNAGTLPGDEFENLWRAKRRPLSRRARRDDFHARGSFEQMLALYARAALDAERGRGLILQRAVSLPSTLEHARARSTGV